MTWLQLLRGAGLQGELCGCQHVVPGCVCLCVGRGDRCVRGAEPWGVRVAGWWVCKAELGHAPWLAVQNWVMIMVLGVLGEQVVLRTLSHGDSSGAAGTGAGGAVVLWVLVDADKGICFSSSRGPEPSFSLCSVRSTGSVCENVALLTKPFGEPDTDASWL